MILFFLLSKNNMKNNFNKLKEKIEEKNVLIDLKKRFREEHERFGEFGEIWQKECIFRKGDKDY